MRSNWLLGALAILAVGFVVWALRDRQRAADDGSGPARETSVSDADVDAACRVAGIVRWEGQPAAARVSIWPLGGADDESAWMVVWAWSSELREWGVRHGASPLTLGERLRDWIALRSAPPLATRAAGDDGRFAFEGLEPGSYVVVATAAGGLAAEVQRALRARGMHALVTLDLEARRETLRGRVVHADGSPAAATVIVRQDRPGEQDVWGRAPVSTDAMGRFVVEGLREGLVQVDAFDPEGLGASLPGTVRVPFPGEHVWTIEGTPASGRVVQAEDGRPIEGAQVEARLPGGRWPARARTDAEGRFHLFTLATHRGLVATATGFLEASVDASDGDVTIRLVRGATLRGRAQDPEGAPVAGVRVLVLGPGHWTTMRLRSVTDGEGRYEIPGLPAGTYAVAARGAGWISSNHVEGMEFPHVLYPIAVSQGQTRDVDLRLLPAARVVGTVRDHVGDPVAGALVWAQAPLDGGDLLPLPWEAYGGLDEAVATRSDGGFVIDALVPHALYEVHVLPDGHPGRLPPEVTPGTRTQTRVDLRLPAPRWVDVKVLDLESGAPVGGAAIQVWARPRQRTHDRAGWSRIFDWSDGARGRTDAQGAAQVGPIGPGHVTVIARAEGYALPTRAYLSVADSYDAEVVSATVRLARTRDVAGRVLMPDGSPARGARVRLRFGADGDWVREQTTDEAGALAFQDLARVNMVLQARLSRPEGDFEATLALSPAATEATLRLEERAGARVVTLRVLDPEGDPVPRARARFDFKKAGSGSVEIQDGHATFTRDRGEGEPSVGSVTVEEARDAQGEPLPLGRIHREGIHSGGAVEIHLPPERTIAGRVVGPDGTGVAGAKVLAEPAGPSRRDDWWHPPPPWAIHTEGVLTDATGAFRFGRLGEGAHLVHVLPPSAFVTPPPMSVTAGLDDVEVVLDVGTNARVTILDAEGRPVGGARVVVEKASVYPEDRRALMFRPEAPGMRVKTGGDGTVRLRGLDASVRYVVGVEPPVSSGLAEHVDFDWSPGDATLRLGTGLAVSGVVRDAEGRPVSWRIVACTRENGVQTETDSAEDGSFRFEGLWPGPVELEVYGPRGADRPAPVRVEAGAEGVELVLGE